MLVEKVLQFKLPSAQPVHILSGEAQGSSPYRLPTACYHIQPQNDNGF
jgi:hypothetical protein